MWFSISLLAFLVSALLLILAVDDIGNDFSQRCASDRGLDLLLFFGLASSLAVSGQSLYACIF